MFTRKNVTLNSRYLAMFAITLHFSTSRVDILHSYWWHYMVCGSSFEIEMLNIFFKINLV